MSRSDLGIQIKPAPTDQERRKLREAFRRINGVKKVEFGNGNFGAFLTFTSADVDGDRVLREARAAMRRINPEFVD